MLEEKLSGIKGNYIMDIDAELANQRNFFDRLGNLNEHGKEQFWRALDQHLRRFSRCRDDYKPKPVIAIAYNARLSQQASTSHREWDFNRHRRQNRQDPNCYRMPPPPPPPHKDRH